MITLEHKLKSFPILEFREDLLSWYRVNKRDLPWRHGSDPYKVWVSEIMLQQTRVDTVIPYYTNFITKFPTVETLASADEQEVLKAWEGLGYYSRARNLQAAVKEVAENYNGKVPDNPEELGDLKGVGPYTKGAILSIAYGKPEPAVDGNVMRVLSRLLSVWEDIAKPKTRKGFEETVRELIDPNYASDFNQAVMELGALICTPKSPGCLLCPVQTHCNAFHEGVEKDLPIKSKQKKPKALTMGAVVIVNQQGEVLINKRPSKGLLANLWEFPNVETNSTILTPQEQIRLYIKENFEIDIEVEEVTANIQHVFSHLIWDITVYRAVLSRGEQREIDNSKWIKPTDTELYPFPVSHQKIIKQCL